MIERNDLSKYGVSDSVLEGTFRVTPGESAIIIDTGGVFCLSRVSAHQGSMEVIDRELAFSKMSPEGQKRFLKEHL